MKTTVLTKNMVDGLRMVAADKACSVHMNVLAALVRRGLITMKTTHHKSPYAPNRTLSISIQASLTAAGKVALAA